MNTDTHPKNALITGISSGLGKALTLRLLEQGYTVFGISRTKPDILENHRGKLWWQPFDLSKNEGYENLVNEITKMLPTIDLVVFNAGVATHSDFESLEDEKMTEMINVNILSTIFLLKKLYPKLGKGSQVIYISSSSVSLPEPNIAIYTAAKAAIEKMFLALSLEAASREIQFKIVRPAAIRTDFARKAGVPGAGTFGKHTLRTTELADYILGVTHKKSVLFNPGMLSKIANHLNHLGTRFVMRLSRLRFKTHKNE